MTKKAVSKKGSHIAPALVAAAAGVAAAGYYFYGSKDAPAHRKTAAKWANDLKKEVEKGVKKLPKVDEKSVAAVIASASSAYKKASKASPADLQKAARELRKNWQHIAKAAKKNVSKRKVTPKKKAPAKRARTGR